MAQQLVNGSFQKGSVTTTIRMSTRYAVVGEPNRGKHHVKATPERVLKRKRIWALRNSNLPWVKEQLARDADERLRKKLIKRGGIHQYEQR